MMTCDGKRGGAFGRCSDDTVRVWHGKSTPALTCGRHATYDMQAVFRGHDERIGR